MGKESKRSKSAASNGVAAPKQKQQPAQYGFYAPFKDEGPLFFIRQYAGVLIVMLGVFILATSYSEMEWLPLSPNQSIYASFGIVCVGAIIHELRPWKRLEHIRGVIDEHEKQEDEAALTQESKKQNQQRRGSLSPMAAFVNAYLWGAASAHASY
eukprot:TRINITY_DN5325_c0_g1_i1.p2 TRINITY_DN5325_c0_g1~~TRINITY_DN5325_c0_g1_i1.p2  ORF type:complete len:155 (-),score=11.58 TRINITY_DN5325_c0_g1_i1:310-774(-)